MLIIVTPWLVALAGLLAYVLAGNPKVQELGKIAFFAGLLAALLLFGGVAAHIR